MERVEDFESGKSEMMSVVSVIVPVYNTEKYIEKCIKSIIAQTYSDWELLLVDDGSTDESAGICLRYADNDSRIKYLYQENSGVSVARNTGIVSAKGDYIYFLDSDDVAEKELLETAVSSMEDSRADMVYFNTQSLSEEGEGYWNIPVEEGLFEFSNYTQWLDFVLFKYLNFKINFAVWNKLYRTNIIKSNSIFFDEGVSMGEDIGFNLKYFLYVKKVLGISQVLHQYWKRSGSIMSEDSSNTFWINDFAVMLKGVKTQLKASDIPISCFNKIYIKTMDNQYGKRNDRKQYKPYVKEVKHKLTLACMTLEALFKPWDMIMVFKNPDAKRKWKDHLFILRYLIFN